MRLRICAALGLVLTLTASVSAQETVTLTAEETAPAIQRYRVDRVAVELDNPDTAADEGVLVVHLVGVERAITVVCTYSSRTSPTGTVLNNGLNKANLSSAYAGNATTGSLKQRIAHRLVTMNEAPAVCGRSLVGTLTGSVP